ncbi:MAG TPA: Spy/CpxP family protein refolding chaperone [Gemmatimonadaceae bacterium]|nr:Spy/CpxP family protein refolding chaperone [Gemmatimonadaceae bacterium]
MTNRLLALLGASTMLLAASSAAAQDTARAATPRPRAEGRMGMGMGMGPGAGPARAGRQLGPQQRGARQFGGVPARAILAMRDRLALTDDQVRRLEALAATQREALRPNEPAMLRARADLMEATRRDDIPAARAAMERMARARTDLAVAHLQARKSARDVLTAEQRTKLDEARATLVQRGRAMRAQRLRQPGRAVRPRAGVPQRQRGVGEF